MNLNNKQTGIISLITISTMGTLALGAALLVTAGALSTYGKNRNQTQGDEAFYAADAAAGEALHRFLSGDISPGDSGQLLFSEDSSSSEFTVEEPEWPYIEITGVSENDFTMRRVVYTVTQFPEGLASKHAVYANTDLSIGGNVTVENGDMFSNGSVNSNGNPEINGDIYSVGTADDSSNNFNGDAYSGVDPIAPPGVNMDFYKAEAQGGGTYFTDVDVAENYLKNPNDGDVVFVDAEEEQTTADTNLTGSLVTTGDLKMNGGTYTASEGYFAVIVLGDLHLAGNAVINGVVYVTGETTFSGGGATINGSLISAQGVKETNLTGNVVLNYSPEFIFMTEGNMAASGSDPLVLRWREE